MRLAFQSLQSELRHKHIRNNISAWELVEGKDSGLCTAFANLCAHLLVMSRVHANATYTSQWPIAINAKQTRIAMGKLVNAVVRYLETTPPPKFLEDVGRDAYFG